MRNRSAAPFAPFRARLALAALAVIAGSGTGVALATGRVGGALHTAISSPAADRVALGKLVLQAGDVGPGTVAIAPGGRSGDPFERCSGGDGIFAPGPPHEGLIGPTLVSGGALIGSRATAFVDHDAAVAAFPEIDSDTFAACLANEMASNATAAGQRVTKAQATRDHLTDVGDAGVVIRVHLSMARPVAGPRGRRTEVTDLWGDVEAFRIDRWAVVVARLAGQSHPLDDGPRAQLTRTLAARLLLS